MAAGGSFNNVHSYFGNNQEDAIIITIDISTRDDSATIVNTYKSYGTTPEFPIILTTGNSKKLANIFGSPNSGGPTFIIHPDREYKATSYGEVSMRLDMEKALKDDCNEVSIHSVHEIVESPKLEISCVNRKLFVYTDQTGIYTMKIYSVDGRLLHSIPLSLSSGTNLISDVVLKTKGFGIIVIENHNKKVIRKTTLH